MAFLFHPIADCKPQFGKSYMFDANCWVEFLEDSKNVRYKDYQLFLLSLINLIDRYETEELLELSGKKPNPLYKPTGAIKPCIILNPLLISEIFNVLLTARFKEWRSENYAPSEYDSVSRKDFRGEPEYIEGVNHVRDQLSQYSSVIEMIDDKVSEIGVDNIIYDSWNFDLDFNDQCYYYQCLESKYILITNDSDFKVQDVIIYTNRAELLSKTDVK